MFTMKTLVSTKLLHFFALKRGCFLKFAHVFMKLCNKYIYGGAFNFY